MDDSKKISQDELKDVTGGYGRLVDQGNGNYEYWFYCSACCDYRELIQTGNTKIEMSMTGTFVCPKCGWTKDFKLIVQDGQVQAFSPVGKAHFD